MSALAADPTIEEFRERMAGVVETIRGAGREWADLLMVTERRGFEEPGRAEEFLVDLFDKHMDRSLPPAFNDKLRAECLAAFRERCALIASHAALRATA